MILVFSKKDFPDRYVSVDAGRHLCLILPVVAPAKHAHDGGFIEFRVVKGDEPAVRLTMGLFDHVQIRDTVPSCAQLEVINLYGDSHA